VVANGCAVDNDFHREGKIFELFDNLEVKNLDESLEITEPMKDLSLNGSNGNGVPNINGVVNGNGASNGAAVN
jgi:hypothetical protein